MTVLAVGSLRLQIEGEVYSIIAYFWLYTVCCLCRAMENTLALMNSKNEGYRKSLTKVDQSCMHDGDPSSLY